LEPTPNPSILIILFGLFIFGFMLCSLFAWIASISWLKLGGSTLPVEDRQPARWGLFHLIVIVVLFVFFSNFILLLLQATGLKQWIATQPEESRESLEGLSQVVSASCGQILAMLVGTIWIAVQTRCSIEEVGWSIRRFGYDLLVGLGAALLFLPLIQILMATLVYSLKMEYDHPLFEAMEKGPVWLMYGGAVFAAVLVAPITEEFLFRVLLQGLLEANAKRPFSFKTFFWGSPAKDQSRAITIASEVVATQSTDTSTSDVYLPQQASSDEQPKNSRLPIWPLFVSGILFGLAHFQYGPSWLPLILMGILLGYLYRCTHRIWPCWIVHLSLNSISMIGFGIQLFTGTKPKMPAAWLQWLMW
jgi:membrane protease YdiL (CAAX protease family)